MQGLRGGDVEERVAVAHLVSAPNAGVPANRGY